MTEPTDHELLAEYARTGDEAPFARLVARHINLVHSAARRYAGNDHLAEEITQAVFLILARKAGSLSSGGWGRRLVAGMPGGGGAASTSLAGWLYQTARLTAANALKADLRRQRREQEAYMQSQENETDAAVWREIAPLLDDAMGRLGETDRTVLVLRFFERQTNAQVASALGLAEGAVQKRVLRALEKLRANFARQGVTHTAQAIAGSVNHYAVLVAPAGLVATICANAAKGAVIATSLSALTNGTLKTLAMTTTQKTLITAALLASVGVGIYQAKETAHARAEVQNLQAQQTPLAEQIQQLQAERDKATNTIAGLKEELAKNEKNKLELLKLRGEVGLLNARLTEKQNQYPPTQKTPIVTGLNLQKSNSYTDNPPFYTRRYPIDEIFLSNLNKLLPPGTNEPNDNNENLLMRFFIAQNIAQNIEFQTNVIIDLKERESYLQVRATIVDLDTIERLLEKIKQAE